MRFALILVLCSVAAGCNQPPPAEDATPYGYISTAEYNQLQERFDALLSEHRNAPKPSDIAAVRAERDELRAELAATRAERDAINQTAGEFPWTVSGELYGIGDEKVFRACNAIEDDRDARNLFLYIQNRLWALRESWERTEGEWKYVHTARGMVSSDGKKVTIRIERVDSRMPSEDTIQDDGTAKPFKQDRNDLFVVPEYEYDGDAVEVVELRVVWISDDELSCRATVKNNSKRPAAATITVQFVDGDGFALDDSSLFVDRLEAGGRETITDTLLVDGEQVPRVDHGKVKVRSYDPD